MVKNSIIVNGVPCKLVYVPDADGFHDFRAIPENDPIIKEIEENYEGRAGCSYLPKEIIEKIKCDYSSIECEAVMSDNDDDDY